MTPARTHSPGRHQIGVLVGSALAALALFAGLSVSAAPTSVGASPATPRAASCSGSSGVSVIIDFRSLGGGVQSRCAPGSPSSGFEALDQAGVGYRTVRGGGFLCNISGVPASNCANIPPASAYWAYWYKPAGGSWTYANLGAGSRTPPAGSTEGWSYYSSACDGPNALPPGANPRPNCPPPPTNPPPATTAAPPPPTNPPATSPSASGSPGTPRPGTNGATGNTGSAGAGPGANQPATAGGAGSPAGTPGGATTVPKPGTAGSATSGSTKAGDTTPGADDGDPKQGSDAQAAGDDPAEAASGQTLDEQAISAREGTRDLAGPDSGTGSPVPVLIGLLLVAVVGGLGFAAARRRRPATG